MKAAFVVVLSTLLLGCNDSRQSTEKSGSSGNIANAPADYLNSAAQAQKRAVKTVDLVAVNKAVEAFYVQEGRFPKKLEELEDKGFIRAIPPLPLGKKFDYDTNSGVVKIEDDLGTPMAPKNSR